jgi:hypothetical protein
MSTLRRKQIGEALGDLERIFFEPSLYGDCSIEDAAVSLQAEVGRPPYRDEEVAGRLFKMIAAERAGEPKVAHRHLGFVRRKLKRLGVEPLESKPLICDAEAAALAARATRNAAKVLVAETDFEPGAAQTGLGSQAASAGEEVA